MIQAAFQWLFTHLFGGAFPNLKETLAGAGAFAGQTYSSFFRKVFQEGEIQSILLFALIVLAVAAVVFLLVRRESRRRFFVALKRKPQNIATVFVSIAFVWYSFNLTTVSFATTRLQGNNMGLTGFAIMLFSTLSIVCCLNAFPYRKPVKFFMALLLFILLGVVIFCDFHYLHCIEQKLGEGMVEAGNIAKITETARIMITHAWLVFIAFVLAATLPYYSKLIRKINTSIEVEDNGGMDTIDISGEDA